MRERRCEVLWLMLNLPLDAFALFVGWVDVEALSHSVEGSGHLSKREAPPPNDDERKHKHPNQQTSLGGDFSFFLLWVAIAVVL